ncbi:MAG: PQQ-like beta-propeller repeat protein [Bryobacteraceae bacterium]|nr:PQQ-like beta-propeller repeat protein [Bryobacteraceae bacterium]
MKAITLWTLCVCSVLGADNWPRWRGPADDGMAPGDAPTNWSDTQNVKWTAAVPGRGFSSPVVWGDQIFLTTAVDGLQNPQNSRGPGGGAVEQPEQQLLVMALDRNTGKTQWQQVALTVKPHEGYHPKYGSFASNSPVTDGKVLIAFFGSRGVYAYDLKGKKLWEKDLGIRMKMRNAFGEGTAPVLHENTLLLNFDHQAEGLLVALDKTSGKELWRQTRNEISSWAPPLVIQHQGKKQMIVPGAGKTIAYDFVTGKPVWEVKGLGWSIIPAPVKHEDMVFVMSGFGEPNLLAVRLGREGDLTGTDAVVWTNQRGNSATPSPVLHQGKLYILTDSGMISCFDAATGRPYYHQQRLPKPYNFKASPVGANGKLYLASEEGDVIVLKMGERYEVLATNTLTDQFFVASPAIADGEIYLRGQNTLFCISEKK